MSLPPTITPRDFDDVLRPDADAWAPSVRAVCRRHDLPSEPLHPYADGSNLVAAVGGELVVKIFPPFHAYQWESERRALPVFADRLPVEVPALRFEGELADGYRYVVLERLGGRSLDAVWTDLDRGARLSLLREIGAVMAAAHALDPGAAASLEPRWDSFLAEQVGGCRARHERQGAPRWVVDDIDAFVGESLSDPSAGAAEDRGDPWSPLLRGPHVLLTGEYTPFNLLVDQHPTAPRLTGMIDFGDAQVGPQAYDVLGPLAFLCGGDRAQCEAFFEGRGTGAVPGASTRRALLALLLLHRYSNLDAQLRVPGWRDAGSLPALADLLCGART